MEAKEIKGKSKYLKIRIPAYCTDDFKFRKEFSENEIPCRQDDEHWVVTIDLTTHKIIEWKQEYGDMYLFTKVVDDGTYSLLDENKNELYRIDGYVPNNLLPEKDGFGDYLTLQVNEDGIIENWYDEINFKDFIEYGFSTIAVTQYENFGVIVKKRPEKAFKKL
ncbi:MAG: hypothetical protein IK025_06675 [Bacteroidales bacterium]|nr:hypothetical protein [Bacteroidales bacterium]